jgi:septum site-determining protein MinC
MRDTVVFKGVRDGLQLVVDEEADFTIVIEQLKMKLAAAADFFTSGATIHINPAVSSFSNEQRVEIIRLLADYGLECECEKKQVDEPVNLITRDIPHDGIGYETQALIVSKTLRGGQKVQYHGSVVVIGDVNPNAAVIAGGNVVILGTCRGLVHAGAYGDRMATITAAHLMAAQIRIAGLIARAPDQSVDKPDCIETARIKEDTVVIERSKR